MEKEKIEKISIPETKEYFELNRVKLDPQNGIDIVTWTTAKSGYLSRVVLEKKGKIVEDFNDEVPRNVYFFASVDHPWMVEHELEHNPVVSIPMYWEDSKEILSFLHELGHVIDIFKRPKEEQERHNLIEAATKVIKQREGTTTQEFVMLREKQFLLRAKNERNAWSNALGLVKKTRREIGVDLLKPFRGLTAKETKKNLEMFIHTQALSSHENKLREDIKRFGLSEKLQGIFTKKYKEEAEEISKEVSEEASKI